MRGVADGLAAEKGRRMNDLIDTTEMYLRTIIELREEGTEPLRARIVERLHQSGPTVSQTVGRLERDGLVRVRGDRKLELSRTGWQRARSVLRKHRLAERLLCDVLGLELAEAHEEACKLEHVLSDLVEDRLAQLLEDPILSPYGCPIPPEDGEFDPDLFRVGVRKLTDVLGADVAGYEMARMSEGVQADEPALAGLVAVGLRPGSKFDALSLGSGIEVRGPDGVVRIDRAVAAGLWVTDRSA